MSMICWILGVSPAQIGALRATPALARDLALVARDEQQKGLLAERMSRMSPERREAAEARQRTILERMPERKEAEARMAALRARLEPLGPFEPALDLEKSWHLLHYLFTGSVDAAAAPAGALMGGDAVGGDGGYGPARLHDAEQTQDFARFLATLDLAGLQARVDYQEMSRIPLYGMPMGGPEPELESELRAEVATYFPRLRDYVARMAEKEYGLLIWLT